MTAPTDIHVLWAGSSVYLNKDVQEKDARTWVNKSTSFQELLEWMAKGHAFTCPLTLNTTNSPAYPGEADPSLGPYMRITTGKSERQNGNALATNLICFDLDGDTTLDEFLATPFAQSNVYAVTTSARHLRVADEQGNLMHRLRVYVVANEPVPLFFDDEGYTDPGWLVKSLRADLLEEMCDDLGIQSIVDESGKDIARLWYGNTGPSHPIGNGDERPAGDLQAIVLGNILNQSYISTAWANHQDDYLRQENDDNSYDDLPVGTAKQLGEAAHIFGNGVLSEERAADYHEWIRLLHAVKKLDPSGETLLEPFLKFSEQSPHHSPCIEDLWDLLQKLPPAEDIHIGITAIRSAADEDTPDWRDNSPVLHNRSTSSAAFVSAGYITAGMDGPMFVHLRKMYERAGRTPPELQQTQVNETLERKTKPALRKRRHSTPSVLNQLQRQTRRRKQLRSISSTTPTHLEHDQFNGYDSPSPAAHSPGSDF